MKRKTCAILAVILALALLFGACGKSSGGNTTTQPTTEKKTTEASNDATDAPAGQDTELSGFENAEGLQYVLIYNPQMYNEENEVNKTLTTGKLGSQVDTSMRRADSLDEEKQVLPVAQNQFGKIDKTGLDLSGDRAGAFFTPYKKGDLHEFYCFDSSFNRILREFECIYAGEIANIWKFSNSNSVTEDMAKIIADEFENTIYDKDVELFGEPRFADNGHKVNILFYDTLNKYTVGVFYSLDLFASNEAPDEYVRRYGMNVDHAVFSVNSSFIGRYDDEVVFSTMAHEFQHLINFSDFFENGGAGRSSTWINEAMSGFVEDYIYPGVEDPERYDDLATSDMVRYGQSLYNFDTDTESGSLDIGAYGSVFLFSMYLENLSGEKVFKNFHDYWRNAVDGNGNDASGLRSSVPSDVASKIDASITYPAGFVSGMSEDEQWLSKLTLDYYLSMLKYDSSDPEQFEPLDSLTLLYDQVNASDIEGGGRVIVAVKDGSFTVPEDADEGLVYIGLDKDFNVITEPMFK